MAEKKVWIDGGPWKLEGLYNGRSSDRAVLVTHPHPLYGGNMMNHVVGSVIKAYERRGHTTLRFNFRGVGNSEGHYGEGIGEQDDVAAALAYLVERATPRQLEVDLAGYSFGAWVNSMGSARFPLVRRMILISPPVAMLDFSFLSLCPKIELVITGARDEFAPDAHVRRMLRSWNPQARLQVVAHSDHFYGGMGSEIETVIDQYLSGA